MSEASHPYHAPDRPRTGPSGTQLFAFAWGFAESTVFFIVPDVLLTRVALRDFRQALFASLWAVAGALLGGTLLWFAARHGATQFLLNAFDWLPGISRELLIRTAQSLDADGLTALARGALSGEPFKLYAVHAGAQDISLPLFLAAAAAARFARFTLTSTVVWLAGRLLRHQSEEFRLRVHSYGWFAFYTTYFVVMR